MCLDIRRLVNLYEEILVHSIQIIIFLFIQVLFERGRKFFVKKEIFIIDVLLVY